MKKLLILAVAVVAAVAFTGCGSLRTPNGKNNKKIYYSTFFGISLESAVYGDGLVVHPID